MIETEDWRPVVGWEGIFEVSSLGRIRRLLTASRMRGSRGRILKAAIHNRNCMSICLQYRDRKTTAIVHTVVMAAFIGPRPAGYITNHINNDWRDNRLANLEYITQKQNVAHSYRQGRAPLGMNKPCAKLTDDAVRDIRRRYAKGEVQTVLAAEYGITQVQISSVVRRRTWKHVP